MDESVRLFQKEQERFTNAGGVAPWLKHHLFQTLLRLALFSAVSMLIMAALGSFPRNPDHSIRLIYSGPVLIGLGAASAVILRRFQLMPRWLRSTLWALIVIPLILVPATLLNMVWQSVR